jgi:ferritin-like metal-binding protein YciE
MAEKTLEKLFHETLKDIYYAERKILKAFAKNGERRSIKRTESHF